MANVQSVSLTALAATVDKQIQDVATLRQMTEGFMADVAVERKLREAAVAQLSVDVAHVRQACERLDAGIRKDRVALGAVTAELEVRGGAGLRAERKGGRTPGPEGIELAKLLEARADEMEATMVLYRAEIADMQADLSRLATQISESDVRASHAAREPTQPLDALVVELRAETSKAADRLAQELQELEQRTAAAAQALGEDVRMQLHATKSETLLATVTAVSEFCSEFQGRVADIEERLSKPEATTGADGVSSVASAAGGAAVNFESEVMDKVLAAVSAAEKRLFTRHAQLCVTLNIDLGRLEVRLDREIARLQKDDQMTPSRSAPAKPGGGNSQAARDAELNRHSADNTDGLATFTLEAVEKRFQAKNISFSSNLQELGELMLGEIAALRSAFTAQAESLRLEMGNLGDGLVLVVEEIQRQHGTALSLPHVWAGTG